MLLFTINNEDQQFTITKLVTSVLTFLVIDSPYFLSQQTLRWACLDWC